MGRSQVGDGGKARRGRKNKVGRDDEVEEMLLGSRIFGNRLETQADVNGGRGVVESFCKFDKLDVKRTAPRGSSAPSPARLLHCQPTREREDYCVRSSAVILGR